MAGDGGEVLVYLVGVFCLFAFQIFLLVLQ